MKIKAEFKNFRNISGFYDFNNSFNVIFGENNSGKSNILSGLKIAFSTLVNDYCKINKTDFYKCDDTNPIEINIELGKDDIPSLNFVDEKGIDRCGFKVIIKKSPNNKYIKELRLLNGTNIDLEIVRSDLFLPNIYEIPLLRIDDIFSDGLNVKFSNLVKSEEKYKEVISEAKKSIKVEMKEKVDIFKDMCSKFNTNIDVEITDPRIVNDKLFLVEGDSEYNYKVGSGYKSIANILLNTLNNNFNIIMIDEIENHLHPSLLRMLIKEINGIKNTIIISTTHSPIVINESEMDNLLYVNGTKLNNISEENLIKLNKFLHPGRAELIFDNNIVLVEGYSEEILLKKYVETKRYNWTIINVAGVMFEPYIELAKILEKKVVVISDNDFLTTKNNQPSDRFIKLKGLCDSNGYKLLETFNTLETDLCHNGIIEENNPLLKKYDEGSEYYVAKNGKKTIIAYDLIQNGKDLSEWHIIKDIENEFEGN